jgi:glycosyltransferase involved in cell wall biosynthesis
VTAVGGAQMRPRRGLLHAGLRVALGGNPPRWPLWMTEPTLRHNAAVIEQAIARHCPDAVLSISSQCLARLRTSTPTYMFHDAPWLAFKQTYARWDTMPARGPAFARAEAEAAQRTRCVFTGSKWAVEQGMKLYGLPRERFAETHLGANWTPPQSRESLLEMAAERAQSLTGGGTLELLFLGKDWERKGGPLALEAAELLHRQGQPVRLHIAGCRPPLPVGAEKYTAVHGVLDLGNAEHRAHLEQLFVACHFLLVPTLAECFGIVFAEAQAFAVPPVSRRVDALPSIIRNGETGLLLPLDAPAHLYAQALREFVTDPARYVRMATAARTRYESQFTWDHVAAVIEQRIRQDLAAHLP